MTWTLFSTDTTTIAGFWIVEYLGIDGQAVIWFD